MDSFVHVLHSQDHIACIFVFLAQVGSYRNIPLPSPYLLKAQKVNFWDAGQPGFADGFQGKFLQEFMPVAFMDLGLDIRFYDSVPLEELHHCVRVKVFVHPDRVYNTGL